jgi:ATPase family associated with various cellular activities (AAA)
MSAEPAGPINSQILVLGTLAFETALIPAEASDNDRIRKYGFRKHSDWVGAAIIQEMIRRALDASARIYPTGLSPDQVKAECGELTTIFDQFQRRSDGKKSDVVWRVKQNYRAWPDADNLANYRAYLEKCIGACPVPDIVVMYEQDRNFRDTLSELSKKPDVRQPNEHDSRSTSALIVALAEDVDKAPIEGARLIFGKTPTTIVLVTADGLRRSGLNIVAYGSIEQTVQELSECLSTSPLKDLRDYCSHLLVLFEETGIVCISNTGDGQGSLHLCPNFDRVAQMDKEIYGRVPGRMAIALTAVTRAVYEWRARSDRKPLDLDPSLRLAVVAYNMMFDKGFEKSRPFDNVKNAVSLEEQTRLRTLLTPSDPKREFLVSSLAFPAKPAKLQGWSRLDCVLRPDVEIEIVLKGVEAAFRNYEAGSHDPGNTWWPASQITCPFMQVGKLQTFDRDEIERLAYLAKLMRKYHDDASWSTPLSIAVFGPPGSGKSFAVKQLMKAVNPGMKESSILTFNLAQFDSLELLTEAFHQVQDQALSSDDVPLVIFDEFDSSFQRSPLGWLKYFLAPMEDGVFRGRTANYKVGRAIFLFAGGTADSFELFTRSLAKSKMKSGPSPSKNQDQLNEQLDQKAVKLPDFASRLMAHLDVLGINPPSMESDSEKIRRRVRRATLLRSLLVEWANPIIAPDEKADVAPEVVRAFLDDEVIYKNQARSMKAVVRGSRWISRQFLVASLPSRGLIELHTEHWPFGRLSGVTTVAQAVRPRRHRRGGGSHITRR